MTQAHAILKQYWGHASFRPLQEDIIDTVLQQRDCLALLPTGGGKSICFQVPAMMKPGLCLVISPLIALMKDQVENLRRKNITAFYIHSGLSRKEVISILGLAGSSNCKFLYVAPERLETNLFKEYLHGLGINLIAVDEAHCISQWGYDFRPSYLRIAALREELPEVPVLALTASATPSVQTDICSKLMFRNPAIFRQSFQRPNLSYSVFKVSSRINKIVDILQKVQGAAIVYCSTRRRTKEISELLGNENISSGYYHAGLDTLQRSSLQEDWLRDRLRVIVCTNAFGMGIDKPDVRLVIHADSPDCLENYYQEAGRAGRDGKKSYAVLLYSGKEIEELKASPAVKFPTLQMIRAVHGALMNHLQIASGTGEGTTHDIDLPVFLRKFDLAANTTLPALKTLEQEELIIFNEPFYTPARCEVTADRERLSDFEKAPSKAQDLLKSLLRNYSGIRDSAVPINEKLLASQVRCSPEEVIAQLHDLQAGGMIRYIPQKDKPQVTLLKNRVVSADLQIDMDSYRKRKSQYESRIDAMIRFVHTSNICRSVQIGNYFGDLEIGDCGICDICLARKKKAVSAKEFDSIHDQLVSIISNESLTISQIMSKVGDIPKEKIMEVVRFLQSENRVSVTEAGAIKLS